MNKDELKKLKRKLETKVYIENAYSGSEKITQYEIEQKIDTLGAVENIEKYYESIITYFSKNEVKYDEITLVPFFSLVIKERDLDSNTIIKSNAKPLPKLVTIRINGFYCIDGKEIFDADPDCIYDENFKEYVVVLDEFINLLEQKGYIYTGLKSVEEIKDKIISGQPSISNITLSFNKKLKK